MDERERQLIESLAARIRNSPAPEINPEADELIRRLIGSTPNALYILTQTVLLQELALNQTQGRAHPPAFLGGAARAGNWGRDTRLRQEPTGGGYRGSSYQGGFEQAPPVQYAQPLVGQPQIGQPQSRMGGFLEGAAQTAAGIVVGQMAFSALGSLFGGGWGHHHDHWGGGGWGGGGNSETTINNNYYGDSGPHDDGGSVDSGDVSYDTDSGGFDSDSYDGGTDSFEV